MKKIGLLFSVIIVIIGVICEICCIHIIQLSYKNNNTYISKIDSKPPIVEIKEPAADEYVNFSSTIYEPKKLKRDLSGFPGSNELTCLFMIYSALDVNYDIDQFCKDYFQIVDLKDKNKVQGKFSPELIWAVSNLYFEKNNIDISCKNLYDKDINIYEIAKNSHYPLLIWYQDNYNRPANYAWQYINCIIVYNAEDNKLLCKNAEGKAFTIDYNIFLENWNKCGNYILMFKK